MTRWIAIGAVLQAAMVLAAGGGAVVSGFCALVGILVSWVLDDVTATILAFGTVSSPSVGRWKTPASDRA